MRTVSQQMSAEERRQRLMHGLNATRVERVVVNFSHLAHAVGMSTAESLVKHLSEMRSLVRSPYKREPELVKEANVEVDRLEVIEAIKSVTAKTEKLKIDKALKK